MIKAQLGTIIRYTYKDLLEYIIYAYFGPAVSASSSEKRIMAHNLLQRAHGQHATYSHSSGHGKSSGPTADMQHPEESKPHRTTGPPTTFTALPIQPIQVVA